MSRFVARVIFSCSIACAGATCDGAGCSQQDDCLMMVQTLVKKQLGKLQLRSNAILRQDLALDVEEAAIPLDSSAGATPSSSSLSVEKPDAKEQLLSKYKYVNLEDDEYDSLGVRNRDSKVALLVVKLAHSGSSWFTALLQGAPQLYLQREGITDYVLGRWAHSTALDQLINYTNTALSRPLGQFDCPKKVAGYEHERYPEATQKCVDQYLEVDAMPRRGWLQPDCEAGREALLRNVSTLCRIPVTGLTIEMTADITLNYKQFFNKVAEAHPGVKVVLYRRSNLVKRALGSGGSGDHQDPIYEPTSSLNSRKPGLVSLGSHLPDGMEPAMMDARELLRRVSIAVKEDNELMQVRDIFPDAVVVNYEELQNDETTPINSLLQSVGIPYRLRAVREERGKKNAEDLSTHFDEATWKTMVSALQKWYPSAVPMLESKVSGEVFNPIPEPNCQPDCLSWDAQ